MSLNKVNYTFIILSFFVVILAYAGYYFFKEFLQK